MNRRQMLMRSTAFLGTALSASLLQGVLAGSYAGENSGENSQSSIFNDPQRQLVADLAETILPKTHTPGAIEVGVPQFIENIVAEWYTGKERSIFLAGLKEIEQRSSRKWGQSFQQISSDQKNTLLREMEQESLLWQKLNASSATQNSAAISSADGDAPFFAKLKELTITGYFTSEIGATEVLSYNPVPGYYDGDYPYQDVGTTWVY